MTFSVAEFRIQEYLAVSLLSDNHTSKVQMDFLTIITVGVVKMTTCITGTCYSKTQLLYDITVVIRTVCESL